MFYIYDTEQYLDVVYTNRWILTIKLGYIDWYFVRPRREFDFGMWTEGFDLVRVGRIYKLNHIFFDYIFNSTFRFYTAFKMTWLFRLKLSAFKRLLKLFLILLYIKFSLVFIKGVVGLAVSSFTYYYSKKNFDENYHTIYFLSLNLQDKSKDTFYYIMDDIIYSFLKRNDDLYNFFAIYRKMKKKIYERFFEKTADQFFWTYFELIILIYFFINFKKRLEFIFIDTFFFGLLNDISLICFYIIKKFNKYFVYVHFWDEPSKLKATQYVNFLKYLKKKKKNISDIRWNDREWSMFSEDHENHRDYYILDEDIVEYDRIRRIWMDLEKHEIEDQITFYEQWTPKLTFDFFLYSIKNETFNNLFKHPVYYNIRSFNFKFLGAIYYEFNFWIMYMMYYNIYIYYYIYLFFKFIHFLIFKHYLIRLYFYHYLSIYSIFIKKNLLELPFINKIIIILNNIKSFININLINNSYIIKFKELFLYYFKLIYVYLFRSTFNFIVLFFSNNYFKIVCLSLILLLFFDVFSFTIALKNWSINIIYSFLNIFFLIMHEILYIIFFNIKNLIYFDFLGILHSKFDSVVMHHTYFYLHAHLNLHENLNFYSKLWTFIIHNKYFDFILRLRPRHFRWKWIERSHRRYIIYYVLYRSLGGKLVFDIKCKAFFLIFYIYYFIKWLIIYFVKFLYIYIQKISLLIYIVYYLYSLFRVVIFIILYVFFLINSIFPVKAGAVFWFLISNMNMFLKFLFIQVFFVWKMIFNYIILILYHIVYYIYIIVFKIIMYISFMINFKLNDLFSLLFVNTFNIIHRALNFYLGIISQVWDFMSYSSDHVVIKRQDRWFFYYTRKLFYLEGSRTHLYKTHKHLYRDENMFFMFHNYLDLDYVKNNLMRIDLVWGVHFFFLFLYFQLFYYICVMFALSIIFKQIKYILKEKQFISFDIFYNWQRLHWENMTKLTNFEFKALTDFNIQHYAWNPGYWEDGKLLLNNDIWWRFDEEKWTVFGEYIKRSIFGTKSLEDDKHDYHMMLYLNLYLDYRFWAFNTEVQNLFAKKFRSLYRRFLYLEDSDYFLPISYYKDVKNFEWLKKLDNDKTIYQYILTNYLYNVEGKMVFVLGEENFMKFYNNFHLIDEAVAHGPDWIEFFYFTKDGLRQLLGSTGFQDKFFGQASLLNEFIMSHDKILTIDVDDDKLQMPKKGFMDVSKVLEFLRDVDMQTGGLINFYLYDFFKEHINLYRIRPEHESYYLYFSSFNDLSGQFEDKKDIFLGEEQKNPEAVHWKYRTETFEHRMEMGNIMETERVERFIVHELRNDVLVYFWAFMICFYFFFLIGFYVKYLLTSRRQIFHTIKQFYFFAIIFIQFWSMKFYIFSIYNSIYARKWGNNGYYEDEVPLFRWYHPIEWLYLRKLQFEYWKLEIKKLRFYAKNDWEWREFYYLNWCFLLQLKTGKGYPMFVNDICFNNYWLVDFTIYMLTIIVFFFLTIKVILNIHNSSRYNKYSIYNKNIKRRLRPVNFL
jgi:hypothetical protein